MDRDELSAFTAFVCLAVCAGGALWTLLTAR